MKKFAVAAMMMAAASAAMAVSVDVDLTKAKRYSGGFNASLVDLTHDSVTLVSSTDSGGVIGPFVDVLEVVLPPVPYTQFPPLPFPKRDLVRTDVGLADQNSRLIDLTAYYIESPQNYRNNIAVELGISVADVPSLGIPPATGQRVVARSYYEDHTYSYSPSTPTQFTVQFDAQFEYAGADKWAVWGADVDGGRLGNGHYSFSTTSLFPYFGIVNTTAEGAAARLTISNYKLDYELGVEPTVIDKVTPVAFTFFVRPVPEPSTVLLFVGAVPLLVVAARRRAHRS